MLFRSTVAILIAEYRIIFHWLMRSYESHRVNFYSISGSPERYIIYFFIALKDYFIKNTKYIPAMQYPIILAIIGAGLLVGTIKNKLSKEDRQLKILKISLISIFLISTLAGADKVFHLGFQIGIPYRFNLISSLNTLLWYISLAASVKLIGDGLPGGRAWMVSIVIFLNMFILTTADGFKEKILLHMEDIYDNNRIDKISFRYTGKSLDQIKGETLGNYYESDLFAAVKGVIGRPQEDYRVAGIEIDPAKLWYNGFFTIDGFFDDYPEEYRKNFFNIIEKELEKNPKWRSRLKTSASHLKLYVGDGTKEERMKKCLNGVAIEYSSEALKELGCSYIITPCDIVNHKELDWTYIDKVGRLRLYEIM